MSHSWRSKAADVQILIDYNSCTGQKRPMFDFYSDMIYDSGEGVESGRCVNSPNLWLISNKLLLINDES